MLPDDEVRSSQKQNECDRINIFLIKWLKNWTQFKLVALRSLHSIIRNSKRTDDITSSIIQTSRAPCLQVKPHLFLVSKHLSGPTQLHASNKNVWCVMEHGAKPEGTRDGQWHLPLFLFIHLTERNHMHVLMTFHTMPAPLTFSTGSYTHGVLWSRVCRSAHAYIFHYLISEVCLTAVKQSSPRTRSQELESCLYICKVVIYLCYFSVP